MGSVFVSFVFQIDDANRMIVGIGDVKFVAGHCQPARLVKRRFVPISLSGLSRTGEGPHFARDAGSNNLIR